MKHKWLLCLLLALSMLPVGVLAVNSGEYPSFGYLGMSGAGLDYATGREVGLTLGIQIMNDDKYTVVAKTKENTGTEYIKGIEFIDGAEVNNLGLARVCEHFLKSYPNPYHGNVFYLLPDTTYNNSSPVWRTTTVEGKLGCTSIAGQYAVKSKQNPDPDKGRNLAKDIYDTIQGDKATVDYFKSLEISYADALSYISYIFGPETKVSGYASPDVSTINKRWQVEYTYGIKDSMKDDDKTKRKLANYVAILTCLSKLLSETDYYSGQIAEFAMRALKGEAYQPIVITAETCINYRIENESCSYNYWRTSSEHLALVAGVAEDNIRNADSDPLYVNSLNGATNMTLAIAQKAASQSGYSGNQYGCTSFLGVTTKGKDTGKGTWGRGMTSLSKSAIQCLRTYWQGAGISVSHDENTPALWGCGIFGGTEALTVVQR